jgi:hypothetical protein
VSNADAIHDARKDAINALLDVVEQMTAVELAFHTGKTPDGPRLKWAVENAVDKISDVAVRKTQANLEKP